MSIRKQLTNQLDKGGVKDYHVNFKGPCGNRFDIAFPEYQIGVMLANKKEIKQTSWSVYRPSDNTVKSRDAVQMIKCFIESRQLAEELDE